MVHTIPVSRWSLELGKKEIPLGTTADCCKYLPGLRSVLAEKRSQVRL